MSVSLFSEKYYHEPLLFCDKLAHVVPRAGYVGEYATLSLGGTIQSQVCHNSLVSRLKAFITCRQNGDLLAVDRKLGEVVEILKKPESVEYAAFQAEVRSIGRSGFEYLQSNLQDLHSIMTANNRKNFLQRTGLAIINLVRGILRKEKISYVHYTFADNSSEAIDELFKKLRKETFRLTEDENRVAESMLEIVQGSDLLNDSKLSAKRIFKMQRGLGAEEISFKLGEHRFFLKYLPAKRCLSLMYGGKHVPLQLPLEAQRSFKISSAVEVSFALLDQSITKRLVAWTEQIVKHGWFKSEFIRKHEPNIYYILPYKTEVQIKVDDTLEPFRFIVHNAYIR